MAVTPPDFFTQTKSPPEDRLRYFITVLFSSALVLFLGFLVYDAVTIQGDGTWKQVKDAYGLLLPAITGTLGTVIGFYFGNKKSSQ